MTKLTKINPNLNAYKFSFDAILLNAIRDAFAPTLLSVLNEPQNSSLLEGGTHRSMPLDTPNRKYFLTSYGSAPLLWISNNCTSTYKMFIKFFDSLNIKEEVKTLVDYDKDIVMYCGFFVICNQSDKEIWHVDYYNNANAYTLITPLFEVDSLHGNLLYKDEKSNIKRYSYKLNEAIIFGDNFIHTTEPYSKTPELRVLISLTFGTDKLKYWDILKSTIGTQSEFMILPCGHQKGTCNCLDNYKERMAAHFTSGMGCTPECPYCGSGRG